MKREIAEAEAFHDACTDAGLQVFGNDYGQILDAAEGPHFGFIMRDNLGAATELIHENRDDLPVEETLPAMVGLAWLLERAGLEYYDRGWGTAPKPDSAEWRRHVENVRAGRIETVAPQFWMTAEAGRNQVTRADRHLNGENPGVEPILAALNYSLYFKPGTMAGAARTLSRSPEEVAAVEELEAMPHLTVSNWAIGETVQHVYEAMAARSDAGRLHIIDMCSGTGATPAAIVNRLGVAQERGHGLDGDRLGIMSFETTPVFYDQLRTDYLPGARPHLEGLGVKEFETARLADFHNQPRTGTISLVAGDIVEGIVKLDMSEVTKDDVLVATANYGFHRLPSQRKDEIVQKLSAAENSVIVVGDLRQNGSAVNRGYFNMSNNGPLNTGNLWLEDMLGMAGYVTRTIGHEGYEPDFVDAALRDRLHEQLDDDGFVTIAVKGPKANELLFGE
ncbi:MAG TPA: hypothetical protein VFX84_02490 [Candidatus Saccharimonadales bacterium]|nr:hypothetical protein [Candidatus Saccharimonadales bacterium]